jgi:hypothetical protein
MALKSVVALIALISSQASGMSSDLGRSNLDIRWVKNHAKSYTKEGYRNLEEESTEIMQKRIQAAPLYGNSTDLQYFFVDVFIGSNREKQSLIVDTGSSIAAVPCKNHCSVQSGKSTCGSHLNPYYDFDASHSKHVYDCI